MKLDPKLETFERREVVAQRQLRYRLIGSIRRIAGLRLWEYDLTTGELAETDLERRVEVGLDARPVFHTRAVWKELCIYVQATNHDNAMKKVSKALRKSGYDLTKLFN